MHVITLAPMDNAVVVLPEDRLAVYVSDHHRLCFSYRRVMLF